MKICHVTYDMRIGGTEQVILNIVQGTFQTDLTHQILCIEAPLGPFADKAKEFIDRIDTIPRKDGFDVSLIFKIRHFIKEHDIDILHCHQYTPWCYGALASAYTNTKVIFTEHGRFFPDSSSTKRKFINPLLDFFTSTYTAISKATAKALVEYEFIESKKIRTLYNGINGCKEVVSIEEIQTLKKTYSIPNDAVILGTIARFDPIKNHEMMIEACAVLNKKNINCILVIVGDGENRENIEALVTRLKIQNKVILTGYISSPQHFYSVFDIFLLTSFSEGTSMTLLEAMSAGLPCIVTDVGGNAELISSEEIGIAIPSNDINALEQSIVKIIQDTDYTDMIKNNVKAHFKAHFSKDKMVNNYESIYLRMNNG